MPKMVPANSPEHLASMAAQEQMPHANRPIARDRARSFTDEVEMVLEALKADGYHNEGDDALLEELLRFKLPQAKILIVELQGNEMLVSFNVEWSREALYLAMAEDLRPKGWELQVQETDPPTDPRQLKVSVAIAKNREQVIQEVREAVEAAPEAPTFDFSKPAPGIGEALEAAAAKDPRSNPAVDAILRASEESLQRAQADLERVREARRQDEMRHWRDTAALKEKFEQAQAHQLKCSAMFGVGAGVAAVAGFFGFKAYKSYQAKKQG